MKKLILILLSTLCGAHLAADESATANGALKAAVFAGKAFIYKTSAGKERGMEIYFPPNHDPLQVQGAGDDSISRRRLAWRHAG